MRTAELAGLRAEVDYDLAEWDYGDLEGLTLEEIRARYPGWTIWGGPWPGGETAAQVAAHADRVVERALSLPPGTNALMITHGHMLRVIAAHWLRLPPTAGRLFIAGTATISVLGWEHGEPAVQCWNARPAQPPPTRSRPQPWHTDSRWTTKARATRSCNGPPRPQARRGGDSPHRPRRPRRPRLVRLRPPQASPSQQASRPRPSGLAPTRAATNTRTGWQARSAGRATAPSAPTAWCRPRSAGTAGAACTRTPASPPSPATAPGRQGSSAPRDSPVTMALIVVNVGLFLAASGSASLTFNSYEIPAYMQQDGQWYRLFTSFFVTNNLADVGLNMLSLLIIGRLVEPALGKWRYLALYLLAGFGGSVATYVLGNPLDVSAGASGAISA